MPNPLLDPNESFDLDRFVEQLRRRNFSKRLAAIDAQLDAEDNAHKEQWERGNTQS